MMLSVLGHHNKTLTITSCTGIVREEILHSASHFVHARYNADRFLNTRSIPLRYRLQKSDKVCMLHSLAGSFAQVIIRPKNNANSPRLLRKATLPVSRKLANQRRSHARVKVSGREKFAQSETFTPTSSPPDAPCPSTAPVRSSAYGCTRSTKCRLLVAFLRLLPSNHCLQPSSSQIVLPSPSFISAPPDPSPPSTSGISTAFSMRGSLLPTKSTVSARLFCPSSETSFRFGLESFS